VNHHRAGALREVLLKHLNDAPPDLIIAVRAAEAGNENRRTDVRMSEH
jgi:hypothetical protein